jgi:hypothetical protein
MESATYSFSSFGFGRATPWSPLKRFSFQVLAAKELQQLYNKSPLSKPQSSTTTLKEAKSLKATERPTPELGDISCAHDSCQSLSRLRLPYHRRKMSSATMNDP